MLGLAPHDVAPFGARQLGTEAGQVGQGRASCAGKRHAADDRIAVFGARTSLLCGFMKSSGPWAVGSVMTLLAGPVQV